MEQVKSSSAPIVSIRPIFKLVLIYFLLNYVVSWTLGYLVFTYGGTFANIFGHLLPFIPGIVGLLLVMALGTGFSNLGFQRCSVKDGLLALFVPSLTVGISILGLLVFGIDTFQPNFPTAFQNLTALLLLLAYAVGEELGWRGFLHGTLLPLSPMKRWIVTGVFWSLWHFPAILSGEYASSPHPLLSAGVFLVDLTAFSVFLGWTRDKTRSLFPAIIAHAVHNFWILEFYPKILILGPRHCYFGTESGVMLTVVNGLVATLIYLKARPKIAHPT